MSFQESFSDLFVHYRKNLSEKASSYISGLFQGERGKRNIERMSEIVDGFDYESSQHFLSDSRWSHQAVFDRIAVQASQTFGRSKDVSFNIDETSYQKKGPYSAGVARQYLGSCGKVDNGQVGVYGSLNLGTRSAITGTRLYLPKEWTDDKDRCLRAKVPNDQAVFKTKEQLAVEILDDAIAQDVYFAWCAADAGYGKSLYFCKEVEKRGKVFMVDIHCNRSIFLHDPKNSNSRQVKNISVEAWVKTIDKKQWKKINTRIGTKGKIRYEYFSKKVWLRDPDDTEYKYWRILVRRDVVTKSDYKYSITNEPDTSDIKRLAYMQGQRYWIERAFQDAKQSCGMADYQVRGWIAWHHHMALVAMASWFVVIEKMKQPGKDCLLSANDVYFLLSKFLPRKDVSREQVINILTQRQKSRKRAAAFYLKQKK
jgi:SRSO17 transposase